MVELSGFTPATLHFLAEQPEVRRVYKGRYIVSGSDALPLLASLRGKDDQLFPGGKWATIQHLEHLIGETLETVVDD